MPGLLQALGGEPRLDPGSHPGATLPQADHLVLDQPDTILRLLNQLHYSRSPVTLHLENENGYHCLHSRIATVLRSKRSLVLQQPRPQDWRTLVAPGSAVEVNCFLATGQLAFVSRLWPLEATDHPGPTAPYCTLGLPAQIVRFQLRTAYRINLPQGSSQARVPATAAAGSLLCCDAPVLDLSLSGCSLLLPDRLAALLPSGTCLPGVRFSLLDGSLHFECDLQLCRLTPGPAGQSLAGLQFLPLPPAVQRRLQQLLTTLQREQLRQQLRII